MSLAPRIVSNNTNGMQKNSFPSASAAAERDVRSSRTVIKGRGTTAYVPG